MDRMSMLKFEKETLQETITYTTKKKQFALRVICLSLSPVCTTSYSKDNFHIFKKLIVKWLKEHEALKRTKTTKSSALWLRAEHQFTATTSKQNNLTQMDE